MKIPVVRELLALNRALRKLRGGNRRIGGKLRRRGGDELDLDLVEESREGGLEE